MFSTWDIVRPRYWHPLASIEQSMMDLDDLADRMLRRHAFFAPPVSMSPSLLAPSPSPLHSSAALFAAPSSLLDDDDFFSDLPLGARRRQQQLQQQQPSAQQQQPQQQQQPSSGAGKQDEDVEMQSSSVASEPSQQQTQQQQQTLESPEQRTFSTYSFSNSSIVDDKGRRIVSTRRRYEDSSGRLKAVHEREIEGKKLRSVWNRMHKDDAGEHETAICAGDGTPEEFEEAWKSTPFGEAQQQQQQQQRQLEQQQQQGEQQQQQHKTSALQDSTPASAKAASA